jgi:hypothetical protein
MPDPAERPPLVASRTARNGAPAQGDTQWPCRVILLSCALVLSYQYFAQVHYHFIEQSIARHREIVSGTAGSPYRYRILVPFVLDPLIGLVARWTAYRNAFLGTYAAYDAFAISFSLLATFAYLRRWFRSTMALAGTLYMAVMMTLALRDHYFMPWSWIEPGLVAVALSLLVRGRRAAILPLTVVAALNRETGLIIPLLLCATSLAPGRRNGALGWCVSALAAWAIVFFGLRWVLGGAAPYSSIPELWRSNTEPLHLVRAIVQVALFGGALWFLVPAGIRHAPQFVRRSALVVPPYLIGVLLFGMWYEVRLLIPLYPIVLPLALFALCRLVDPGAIRDSAV